MTDKDKLLRDIETLRESLKLNGMGFDRWPPKAQQQILKHGEFLLAELNDLKEKLERLTKTPS